MGEFGDNRMIRVSFRLAPDEVEFVKKKAELSGAKNLSCYLRKMVITGTIINYDDDKINKLKKDVAMIGNNVNQIAMRVNKTGTIYSDDISEIKEKVNELCQSLTYIQSTLRCIKQ